MSEEKLKIVFFGTADFAVPALQVLQKRHIVQAVVTQPDAKQGRKMELTASPVKIAAQELEIPILQPEKVKNNTEFINLLKELAPDFIIVIAYGQIIPQSILEIPKYMPVNLHGSLLPQFRGASPVQQSLLNGDTETGVTFIEMDEGIDTGNIILIRKMLIEKEDDLSTLSSKLAILGALIFPELLEDITLGLLPSVPQIEDRASYCQKIKKEDGKIDWQKETSNEIINKLRAFTPWPGIFTFLDGKRVKILQAEAIELIEKYKAGTIINTNGKLNVATIDGALEIKTLQIEGKNKITGEEFLKGHPQNAQFE